MHNWVHTAEGVCPEDQRMRSLEEGTGRLFGMPDAAGEFARVLTVTGQPREATLWKGWLFVTLEVCRQRAILTRRVPWWARFATELASCRTGTVVATDLSGEGVWQARV